MDAWNAVTARRQVRSFTDETIADDVLHRILEAGRRAPSSRNSQPWDLVVVRDREQLERLSGVWRGASWITGSAATVAIVLPVGDDERSRTMMRFDAGQLAVQMMIAAAGFGIGSGQTACEDQPLAREVLGLPADRECASLIALGYPADRPLRPISKPSRRAFEDVVHFDQWQGMET